ncbi:MAG: hypothetical protein MUC84_00575 [Solirubrobacteraceae bacterium]|nr:hypothetical protein [Solirubrobacteraceae bacterium]
MDVLAPLLVIALLLAVVWFVGQPLRRGAQARTRVAFEGRRADLEAARDAKYAEIRDLEMDRRTGKLSDEDWRALDRQLRAEAVDILHALDELGPAPGAARPEEPAAEEADASPQPDEHATLPRR